jgi:hypothetical protein
VRFAQRALTIDDVDLAAGKIHVRRSWDSYAGPVEPKSPAGARVVRIPAVLRDYLDEHLLRLGWGLIFGRSATQPFNSSSVWIRTATAWRKTHAEKYPRRKDPRRWLRVHAGARSDHPSRVPSHVREPDDRLRRECERTLCVHGSIMISIGRYGHLFTGNEDEAGGLLDAYLERANTAARLARVGS